MIDEAQRLVSRMELVLTTLTVIYFFQNDKSNINI